MITFTMLSLLLFVGIWYYPTLERRAVPIEMQPRVKKLYYLTVFSLYLTLLFSDSFYITHFLGWASFLVLMHGYFPTIRQLI